MLRSDGSVKDQMSRVGQNGSVCSSNINWVVNTKTQMSDEDNNFEDVVSIISAQKECSEQCCTLCLTRRGGEGYHKKGLVLLDSYV